MSFSPDILATIDRLQCVSSTLKLRFARRDTAIDLIALALVCREHLLFLGSQGTAKSELVARFAASIQCETFQYLLTHFTHPSELRVSQNRVVFLDDVFQVNSAIVNTLIGLIQDRVLRNETERQTVPLIALFAASRTLPEDLSLRAFSDRFLLRTVMTPVQDASLAELLEKGAALEGETAPPEGSLTPEDLDDLYRVLPTVAVDKISPLYQGLLRHLRAEGVSLSDRRIVKGFKLIRAAALLEGREEATPCDLWPIAHVWSSPEESVAVRDVLQPLIEDGGGTALEDRRSLEDLREDLELLLRYAPHLRGEERFTAHLSALGQLRREITLHFPSSTELLARVEAEVERIVTIMDHRFTK